MDIATITYHRADNYGAVLQAFALCKYLQMRGHNAEIVDYWPTHHAKVYKAWTWTFSDFKSISILYIPKYFARILVFYFRRITRKKRFDSFRKQYMSISKSTPKLYDAAFYGSDTIWNRWNLNKDHIGFDDVYWGSNYVKALKKFSYAPSMGNVIDNNDTLLHCKRMLPNFSKISVREKYLKDKLEEWGWCDITKTVDPTLLISPFIWKRIGEKRIIPEEYILCYNLESSKIIDEAAAAMRKERNLRVIFMTALAKDRQQDNVLDTAGPVDFISLFNYASFILTSSFHGVIFSLIFQKQFIFNSATETERISSILESLDISDRFIHKTEDRLLIKDINYINLNTKLEAMKKDSLKYIEECLEITYNAKRNL